MNKRMKNIFWLATAILVTLWVLSMLVPLAYGSEDDDCRDAHDQCGHDGGDADSDANADSAASADASANAEGGAGGGGDASIVYGKRAPTNFLYMQNQVEACGRTFGSLARPLRIRASSQGGTSARSLLGTGGGSSITALRTAMRLPRE